LTKNVVHKLLNLRSTKRPNYYFESFFRKLFSDAENREFSMPLQGRRGRCSY